MTTYLRDDIYFCPGCCGFHDEKTGKRVEVPGMEYFEAPGGKIYKVRKPRKPKPDKPSKGFGN